MVGALFVLIFSGPGGLTNILVELLRSPRTNTPLRLYLVNLLLVCYSDPFRVLRVGKRANHVAGVEAYLSAVWVGCCRRTWPIAFYTVRKHGICCHCHALSVPGLIIS